MSPRETDRPAAPRVAVLSGGPSEERAVSLESGAAVAEALVSSGFPVVRVTVEESIDPLLPRLAASADVVFIALHGRYGEDGTVQEALEDRGIPYTGSGPAASRLGMVKTEAKRLFEGSGVCTPKYRVIGRQCAGEVPEVLRQSGLSPPLVVKPVASGSSIGVSVVRHLRRLGEALACAWRHGEEILVEEYVDGRELTVGVLDGAALPVVELMPRHEFFDYESKYSDGLTRVECPASLEGEVAERVRRDALRCFEAVGARDFGRVDVILGRDQVPRFLEVNTIPGFTAHSLLPVAAQAAGISFGGLVSRIVEMALRRGGLGGLPR